MNSTQFPLTFARNSAGILCHVDDVENGIACGCVCPMCGERLVARHGEATVHHFAHKGNSDCVGGVETAIHLAAKEILSKALKITLPPVVVTGEAVDTAGVKHIARRSTLAKSVALDAVAAEVPLGEFVPDILATVGGRSLAVEIAVTHFSDEGKIAAFAANGLAAVEVDLSGMTEGWSWESLTVAVVELVSNKKWLFNPKSAGLLAEARHDAEKKAAAADKEAVAATMRIRESHDIQRASIPQFAVALRQLIEFTSPSGIAAERARMEAEGQQTEAWLFAARLLGLTWAAPPIHLNVEVAGEMGCPVDRRVWQAALFAIFIAGNRNKTFSTETVTKWCVKTFGWRSEFAVLHKNSHLLTPDEREILPSAVHAVRNYLSALEGYGYISRKGNAYEISGIPKRLE